MERGGRGDKGKMIVGTCRHNALNIILLDIYSDHLPSPSSFGSW